MKVTELKEELRLLLPIGEPVLIKGAPGIGKSDIVTQIAEELGYDLIIMHPVVSDPTDFKGLPGIVDGKAEWLPYGELRDLIEAKKPTIAFLDDIGQAPAVVQAAAMQLLQARRINGKKVSDKVVFVGATNRREDKAHVTGILETVKSRFGTIIELIVDLDDWISWAIEEGLPTEVVGFMHFRGAALLHNWEPVRDIVNKGACPRTWHKMAKYYAAGGRRYETIAGAVGEGNAAEFMGFVKVYSQLPNIDALILDPDSAEVPTEPSAQYAVVSAVIEKTAKDNFGRIMKYVEKLPAEFTVLYIRDVIRRNKELQNTKAFIKWATKHKDLLM